jgi:hypothetical protein
MNMASHGAATGDARLIERPLLTTTSRFREVADSRFNMLILPRIGPPHFCRNGEVYCRFRTEDTRDHGRADQPPLRPPRTVIDLVAISRFRMKSNGLAARQLRPLDYMVEHALEHHGGVNCLTPRIAARTSIPWSWNVHADARRKMMPQVEETTAPWDVRRMLRLRRLVPN